VKIRHFAAIILAGGFSSRMKQFKPLLPLGGATVTDHVVSTFLGAGVDVFLVVGHRREEITARIKNLDVNIIYNPDYEKGMFSSIQAGIRQLKGDYQAFFILPVDIPLVKPATIKHILNTGRHHPDNIIYPTYEGKRGHPPLIPARFITELLEWQKEGGLKSLLKTHDDLAYDVPVTDSYILFDIDTPEDYQELLRRFRK